MRTYLCLYLFSPVVNSYLRNITMKRRLYLLISLFFICIYLGTASVCDPALNDGKNLANFVFLYVVGNTLHFYAGTWRQWSTKVILYFYLFLNLVLIVSYILFKNSIIGTIIFHFSFPYCSPILLLNALLFMILVAKHPFKSKFINYIGSSVLAIYLIHCSPIVIYDIIYPIVEYFKFTISNDYAFVLCTMLLALVISVVCIIIDKILSPLWSCFSQWGEIADYKINQIRCKSPMK